MQHHHSGTERERERGNIPIRQSRGEDQGGRERLLHNGQRRGGGMCGGTDSDCTNTLRLPPQPIHTDGAASARVISEDRIRRGK